MKKSTIILTLSAALLFCGKLQAQDRPQVFREAVTFYENGVYGRARSLFEELGDPLSQAYAVLCAVKVNASDYQALMDRFLKDNPTGILNSRIHFAAGQNYFDAGDFAAAGTEFASVDPSGFSAAEQSEFLFKKGYSSYKLGNAHAAVNDFVQIQGLPYSAFTAPSRYCLAYIAYGGKDFDIAEQWFRKCADDERFAPLSNYYIMECRFMAKDYDYVIEGAPAMLESVPSERKGRLARILSESCLVKGDNEKALEYYRIEKETAQGGNRSDHFHAGSVMYAVRDYQGAIDNFALMKDEPDSIGQIANYEMAYSYIQTGNKVAAAGAFKKASELSFDPRIQEDAAFSYAKLSFDLNGDTAPFADYMKKYSSDSRSEQIYNYMAIADLNARDYAGAIENYEKIEELDDTQKGNYIKANYLRGNQLISGGSWSSAVPFMRAAGFYYPKTNRFNQLSRYWLAECYFNIGNYGQAESIWEDLYNTSALRGMTESELLPYNLGYAFYTEKKYESAARWFDIYAAGGDALCREDALVRRADCDFARHRYGEAIASYKKVIDEFGSNDKIYPYYQQALAYGLSGDKKTKISVLSKVKRSSPDAPLYSEAMYELGRAYMENGDCKEAVNCFEKLRVTTGDNTFAARALIGKGMAYRNMKEYSSALDQYKQVVDLLPESQYSEEALLAINSIYQTTGEPEKYIEYVETNGISLGNTVAEREAVYFNTAEQIYLAGNYTQAVSYLRKYLADYPDGAKRGDASFYLADSYRQMGEKEKACECYNTVAKYLSEGSFAESAALNYAALSYELERFADAYDGYSRLLQIAKMPDSKPIARLGKLRSAYAAKRWAETVEAGQDMKRAGDPEPQLREADFVMAKSYLAQSRRDEAFALFKKLSVLTSTPEGAESAYMLVQDSFDNGKFDEAESKVYEFSGKFGNQNYWLARCYIVLADSFSARGNAVQAKATLESVRDGYEPSGEGDDIATLVNEHLNSL